MYKIAVIGDRESIVGFASIGLDTFEINDKAIAAAKLKSLAQDGYAVIFITEALAAEISEEILKFKDNVIPSVVLIPGVTGNTGEGMTAVNRSIERAVGSQII